MEKDGTLNLLLIHDTIDEANRLVSLLRNASYKIDPQHVEKQENLSRVLQEKTWDLACIQYAAVSIPFKTVFQQIRRLNKDIPVIMIAAEHDPSAVVDGLRIGASDVITMDEDQHLLQVVSRTLYNLDQRRRLRYWKRRYVEAEERCEHLLKNSRDGIAIIQDGTYVEVNETFAQQFGYVDADGMTLLPVLDSIDPGSQQKFMPILKPLDADEARDPEAVEFKGIKPDGTSFSVHSEISQVEHQGEPALQLLIDNKYLLGAAPGSAGAGDSNAQSLAIIRPQPLLEHINVAIRKAAHTEENAVLLYIQVDRFQDIQSDLGLRFTEEFMVNMAQLIESLAPDHHILGRLKEDAFLLLMDHIDVDASVDFGEALAIQVADTIVDMDDHTCKATVSIGISLITDTSASPEGCIDRCMKAINSLREKAEHPQVGNGANLYEAVFEPSAPDLADADIIRFGTRLLEQHLLHIVFQPIVPLHGEPRELYEVLMRPDDSAMPENLPEDFISKVFKTEVGKDIDRWVILESIKTLAKKQKSHPDTCLLINISAATLCDDQFIPWLKVALKATGIAPQALVFQLREIDVSRHFNRAVTMSENLHKFRSQTALTHFGLSINPLQVLDRLKVDYVKLDMLVVEKARKDDEGMDTMVDLIKELKAEERCVVVPFIENAAMIPALWQAGVHYIQGHYIHAPMASMNYEFIEDA